MTWSRASLRGAKKICKWFGFGSTRVTTPVITYVFLVSYSANE